MLLYGDKEQAQREVKSIEALYVRAAESRDPAIANQAKAMLFSKYMERRELDRAKKVLDELPDQPQFDKKQMQSAWYMAQDKWEDAARLTEHRVLTDASGLQSALLTLAEIAVKESRMEDAETLTQTAGKLAELFHLGEYSAWVPAFQLALLRQDADRCLDALEYMLPALESGWTIENSPLYRHLPPKKSEGLSGGLMLSKVLEDFSDPENPEYDFLRGDARFLAMLKKFNGPHASPSAGRGL